ncbi:hypothetical protein OFP26_40295, partial [Escherichia coli]|nr:hypothetical protein [Escherichia coli]
VSLSPRSFTTRSKLIVIIRERLSITDIDNFLSPLCSGYKHKKAARYTTSGSVFKSASVILYCLGKQQETTE